MKKEFTISNIMEHPMLNNKEFQNAFTDFLSLRRKMKRPVTERGEKLLLLKLLKLSSGDEAAAVKIIDQSIEHGWQGFYPAKTN